LPDVAAALAWLEGEDQIDLALAEPQAEDVRRAGRRLAHVRASRESLPEQALRDAGFRGVAAVPLG
jgi:hypothetical protein